MNIYKNKFYQNCIFWGAVLGFCAFMLIYGINVLNPLNDSFILGGYLEKDAFQHYSGWLLFKNSPWTFPLGVGQNIEYPYGSSVSYTDSIPLFAIFFKIFAPVLPDTFQYFGLFVCLCFILQGIFGALLVNLFTQNKLYAVIGSLFFIFSSVMIERAVRHTALTAHFLILAALYLYFKNRKFEIKNYIPFYIINILAITIHPYFLPFTFGIMFAYAVENFFKSKGKNKIYPPLQIVLSIVSTLFIGYAIGAFYVTSGSGKLGFGYFNMNLNAYFNPVSKNFDNWSNILTQRPLINGQTEGFNYLGAGILILLVICAVLVIKNFKDVLYFIKNYYGIIFSAFCLTLFAVLNVIAYGGLVLFTIPLSENLIVNYLNIFRANGRFGYIMFYLFIIFAVFGIFKYIKNKKISIIILAVAFAVQLFDISGAVLQKHNYFYGNTEDADQKVEFVAQHSFWQESVKRLDGVIEMESEEGTLFGNGFIDIAYLCGKYDKYINSNFAARTDTIKRMEYVYSQKDRIAQGKFDNVMYIVEETKIFDSLIKSGACQCFEVDGQLAVVPSIYSEQEIEQFTQEGNFKQIILQ